CQCRDGVSDAEPVIQVPALDASSLAMRGYSRIDKASEALPGGIDNLATHRARMFTAERRTLVLGLEAGSYAKGSVQHHREDHIRLVAAGLAVDHNHSPSAARAAVIRRPGECLALYIPKLWRGVTQPMVVHWNERVLVPCLKLTAKLFQWI